MAQLARAIRKKLRGGYLFVILLLLLLRLIPLPFVEKSAHVLPDYPKVNLSEILAQKEFSPQDYETLYLQTGLGKIAIDHLCKEARGRERILYFQDKLFQEVQFSCEPNSIVSNEERLVDGEGKEIEGTAFALLENGYVLLTKSSHTFWWRNGHAALVVDAAREESLESVVLGTNSCFQDLTKWLNYPNFIILKLKTDNPRLLEEVAAFAKTYLNDLPYSLTVGLFSPKFQPKEEITGTQCAHLVWRAFREFGYDLDKNSIVTPKALAQSPFFEVVQVYGMNPKNPWP